jgi:dihydrofolate synthase/folylpolyglutamate synthase
MGDKDVDGIFEELEDVISQVIVSRNTSHRAAPVDELLATAQNIFGANRAVAVDSLSSAIQTAIEQAKLENAVNDLNSAVLIAGSVVTAGEARAIIRKLREKK